MNLILFEPAEINRPLAAGDPRVRHVLAVLHRAAGDAFDAGIINGPRGKARLRPRADGDYDCEFTPTAEPPPAAPIALVIGLPRPQTARDILRDATTLGVQALHFVATEKGDPNYASSALWRSGEWRRHVVIGAEQAFCTRLPEVTHGRSLAEVVAALMPGEARFALDNYEAAQPLARSEIDAPRVTLAIGAERGWSTPERALLRHHGFTFAHLGERVLRTETACIAAITLVRAALGVA
ncbi:RsmE family RNA methyltransferase [Opitutus terrae]|uniref:RsmE family RNA methyltransferase n=1 Tax=Opitutus terrae TaxID=107709 RepID=UPI0002EC3162|nr:RsmE family RNA methyltransferase [Opitutus terrae]